MWKSNEWVFIFVKIINIAVNMATVVLVVNTAILIVNQIMENVGKLIIIII